MRDIRLPEENRRAMHEVPARAADLEVAAARQAVEAERQRVEGVPHARNAPVDARPTLRPEEGFQVQLSDAGRDTYGAASGLHDDLVTALALACWQVQRDTDDLREALEPPPREFDLYRV